MKYRFLLSKLKHFLTLGENISLNNSKQSGKLIISKNQEFELLTLGHFNSLGTIMVVKDNMHIWRPVKSKLRFFKNSFMT